MMWEPIETAPKDGMDILIKRDVANENISYRVVSWDNKSVYNDFNWHVVDTCAGFNHHNTFPTHWIPLDVIGIKPPDQAECVEELKLEVTKWTELANLHKTMPMKYIRMEFNAQLEATIAQLQLENVKLQGQVSELKAILDRTQKYESVEIKLQEDNIRMREILISLESMATGFIKYKIKEVLGETK